jgi:hypothetical protein
MQFTTTAYTKLPYNGSLLKLLYSVLSSDAIIVQCEVIIYLIT